MDLYTQIDLLVLALPLVEPPPLVRPRPRPMGKPLRTWPCPPLLPPFMKPPAADDEVVEEEVESWLELHVSS